MKYILALAVCLGASITDAQNLNVGIRIQKTYYMYWENGISAQYSFANFKPKQFYLGFDYVTSRLGTAYKSNALKQDNYIFSGSWFFNKEKPYHIVTRLNFGYFFADMEEDIFKELPHTSFLFSPEIGFTYEIPKVPLSVNLGMGYYILTAKEGYSPGTLQPLYFHFDLYYQLFNRKQND